MCIVEILLRLMLGQNYSVMESALSVGIGLYTGVLINKSSTRQRSI